MQLHQRDHGRYDQHLVGKGVDELPQGRHQTMPARNVAVEGIRQGRNYENGAGKDIPPGRRVLHQKARKRNRSTDAHR